MKSCKDCVAQGLPLTRPLVDGPGPRCATHMREFTKRSRKQAHASRVARTYGKEWGELYDDLKEFQGGTCAICKRARGLSKNLSVDHDHTCCNGKISCGKCVRGLLCTKCNDILGHARDDVDFFIRAVDYLTRPPAQTFREQREMQDKK